MGCSQSTNDCTTTTARSSSRSHGTPTAPHQTVGNPLANGCAAQITATEEEDARTVEAEKQGAGAPHQQQPQGSVSDYYSSSSHTTGTVSASTLCEEGVWSSEEEEDEQEEESLLEIHAPSTPAAHYAAPPPRSSVASQRPPVLLPMIPPHQLQALQQWKTSRRDYHSFYPALLNKPLSAGAAEAITLCDRPQGVTLYDRDDDHDHQQGDVYQHMCQHDADSSSSDLDPQESPSSGKDIISQFDQVTWKNDLVLPRGGVHHAPSTDHVPSTDQHHVPQIPLTSSSLTAHNLLLGMHNKAPYC